ncbi:hypothetical protein Dimus_024808 [Dionaea muscipula]
MKQAAHLRTLEKLHERLDKRRQLAREFNMEETEFTEEQEVQEELNVDLPETNQELGSTEGHDNANSKKRGRGRTMKKSAHLQTLEGQKPIILNALGQAIGLEEYINDFIFFMGTLSRMPNLCPLNVEKWTDMDKVYKGVKERIWKYVKRRWLFPDQGKNSCYKPLVLTGVVLSVGSKEIIISHIKLTR